MVDVSELNTGEDSLELPPGFRFHPTDEEIITHYLSPKVLNQRFSARAMGEVDLNKCEPWELPSQAKMGEKEWYFFCQRDRKYPTGMRTNRATEAGYWKATGKDKEIFRGRGVLVGMKKTLVFYKGRAPKGEKSNWVMHEYRLEGKIPYSNHPKSAKDEWVVCRVFHKNSGPKKIPMADLERINSFGDDLLDLPTLPPLMEPPYFTNSDGRPGSSYAKDANGFDFRGIPSGGSTSMPSSFFSSMVGMGSNPQGMNPAQNSAFCPQISADDQGPYFSLPGSGNLGYLHPEELRALAAGGASASAIRKHCKVEQYSNQSMVSPSQDTGLSTDHNTEISSVSKYDDFDDPSSAGPVIDYENMWKF